MSTVSWLLFIALKVLIVSAILTAFATFGFLVAWLFWEVWSEHRAFKEALRERDRQAKAVAAAKAAKIALGYATLEPHPRSFSKKEKK